VVRTFKKTTLKMVKKLAGSGLAIKNSKPIEINGIRPQFIHHFPMVTAFLVRLSAAPE
jgi:hypothetical protein